MSLTLMRATKPPAPASRSRPVTFSRCQTARGEVSPLALSSLRFAVHVPTSRFFFFLIRHSLLLVPIHQPPMRSGRSAGIGARVLRAPGRSCHDRQAGCRFLRAGSVSTVCAYRAEPDLGHPASQRRDARRSALHCGDFWAGSRFALLGQSLRARAMTSRHRHGSY